jgi:anti-sigma factor RsiW
MTDQAHTITEDQLHAYVDGLLDETARRAVERYLAQNADAATRVKSWQTLNRGLQQLASGLSATPGRPLNWKHGVDGDELGSRRARKGFASRVMQITAVAASLAIGVLGGWYANEAIEYPAAAGDEIFVREAASAYQVFASPVQARPVEMKAEERDLLQRWLSHKMSVGFAMKVPQLDGEGWALVGGRLLSNAYGPAALYVYERPDAAAAEPGKKVRIALYVTAKPELVKKPLSWPKGFSVEICDWGNDRLHMALAGPVARDQMKKLLGPINTQIIASTGTDASPLAQGVPELPVPQIAVSLNPQR